MPEPDQRRAFLEWDVRNWSTALDFWRANTRQNLATCSVLEIGSRNGGLSLWFALQGARVVCSDLAGPSQRAVDLHRTHGVSAQIEYRAIDATQIPYTEHFNIIVFKSVLGGVGAQGGWDMQAHAVREMHRALRKGGELLFAENLTASPIHRYLRTRFVPWGTRWRYTSLADMEAFLSSFAQVHLCTAGFAGAFGRTERQREWLGLLDQGVLNRLVPASWRYIIAGVAEK